MQNPPPLPGTNAQKRNRLFLLIAAIIVVVAVGGVFAFRSIIASGITRGFDNKFGDQYLKTAVALIELHKVRYGKYPDSLRDLKFTGDWDQIALVSVRYYPTPNRDAYYIEVERDWMGKPTLTIAFGILERHWLFSVAQASKSVMSNQTMQLVSLSRVLFPKLGDRRFILCHPRSLRSSST
jgi:hypothetical protein